MEVYAMAPATLAWLGRSRAARREARQSPAPLHPARQRSKRRHIGDVLVNLRVVARTMPLLIRSQSVRSLLRGQRLVS